MQHAVQAVARTAVAVAAAAILLPVLAFVAQPQPGEFSDGSTQDGPVTRM
jgi:hypothetical protein